MFVTLSNKFFIADLLIKDISSFHLMIISLATLACQPEKPVQDTEITHAKPDSIIDEYLSQYKPYPMDFDGSNYNETEQAILKNLVKARFNGIIKPVSERLNYQ